MSFSVDLWNGFDIIKTQIFSVQKKIKTISKVLQTYLTIESTYNKNLENLYKEFKEANNSEYLLDESYIKILDIFEYENQNRKIFCSFVTQLIMEPLNEYLRQPNIPLNKYFSDNIFNEESFKRSLNLLKDKQANYWNNCKELSVLLAQNELEDVINDKKSRRAILLKINERFNKVNMSKQEYVDYINEANTEREKYNRKTEDILNNLEQIYVTMVETLKNVLTNFASQRNEFLKKMYSKEKNEYESIHAKVNPKEELFNFITNNATKEFPKIKFEFCPMKYSVLNQNIKSKCNKIPESAFPKVYKAVKEFFEDNKIFKEENPFRITRKNTDVFGLFTKKLSRNPIQANKNEQEQNKEFIEKYITDLFVNKPSNNKPKTENNIQNPNINMDKQEDLEKTKNNNEIKQNDNNEQNQKENINQNDNNNQKENTNNLKSQETEQKNELKEVDNNKNEKINDEQAKEETKKETENNKDNNEIKTNTENIDKKETNNNNEEKLQLSKSLRKESEEKLQLSKSLRKESEEKLKLSKSLRKESEEKTTPNNETSQSIEEKDKIQTLFYSENPNYFQNAEILIKKLSYLRSKGHFQINDNTYYQILSLFFIILNQESKDYYILKNILILSQTFYKIKNNKKIYLQEGLRGIKVFSNPEAWHRVINYSMNLSCSSMDLTQTKEDMIEKINKEAQIIVVAYLCDIKQYTVNDDVFNEVKNYYIKVYNMDEDMVNKEVEKYVNSLKKNESSEQEKHMKIEEKNKNDDDIDNDNDKNLNNMNELEDNNFIKQRSYSTPINIIQNNITSNNIENEILKTKTDKQMNNPKEKEISDNTNSQKDKKIEVINTTNNNNANPESKNQIINNNINIIKIEAKEVIIVDNSKNNINIEQIKEIKKDAKDILKENNIKIDNKKEKTKDEKINDLKKDMKEKGKK